jgi:hypothetical protein
VYAEGCSIMEAVMVMFEREIGSDEVSDEVVSTTDR